MKVHLTRDSVCAGDDGDAPHEKTVEFADDTPLGDVLDAIAHSGYLASIMGGQATWSAVSGRPLAIVAQQWAQPKMLPGRALPLAMLEHEDGVARLHFRYHQQKDPNAVFGALAEPAVPGGAV